MWSSLKNTPILGIIKKSEVLLKELKWNLKSLNNLMCSLNWLRLLVLLLGYGVLPHNNNTHYTWELWIGLLIAQLVDILLQYLTSLLIVHYTHMLIWLGLVLLDLWLESQIKLLLDKKFGCHQRTQSQWPDMEIHGLTCSEMYYMKPQILLQLYKFLKKLTEHALFILVCLV